MIEFERIGGLGGHGFDTEATGTPDKSAKALDSLHKPEVLIALARSRTGMKNRRRVGPPVADTRGLPRWDMTPPGMPSHIEETLYLVDGHLFVNKTALLIHANPVMDSSKWYDAGPAPS